MREAGGQAAAPFGGWARRIADDAKRAKTARAEAAEFTRLVSEYLRARRSNTATMGRWFNGRWFVELEPARSPVLVRRLNVYGRGGGAATRTALLVKTDLAAWLRRERDVDLRTLTAALVELGALVGPPAGRRVAMASKTRVVGVAATAIEVDLAKLDRLAKARGKAGA